MKTLLEDSVNGAVLYQGPSAFDGNDVVAIVTGLTSPSTNSKTGPMLQIYILVDGRSNPVRAWLNDSHRSVCGDCKHGHANADSCYVNLGTGVNAVWRAYKAGSYAPVPAGGHSPATLEKWFAGRKVRFGAFGDPAAVPIDTWLKVIDAIQASPGGGWTGYTHAWRYCDQRFRDFVVASVDDPDELAAARDWGWRTFRTMVKGEPLAENEFMCPATDEGREARGRHVTCSTCLACNGRNGKARRGSAAIVVHGTGYKVKNYVEMRLNGRALEEVSP